jgi:hypothetical protein
VIAGETTTARLSYRNGGTLASGLICSDPAEVVQDLICRLQRSRSNHAVVHKVVIPGEYRDHNHRNTYHGLHSLVRAKTMLTAFSK